MAGKLTLTVSQLNEYIRKYARGWKLERISRVAAALLRCAFYHRKLRGFA